MAHRSGRRDRRRMLAGVEIPIACSLQPASARSQLGEWRELLARVVDGSERVTPTRLELSLLAGSDIGPVIDLAQRETACCPFFRFSVEITAERLALVVEVPDDATVALDQLGSPHSG